MSTYRETPAPEPLLLTMGQLLMALDPDKGLMLWQLRLPMGVRRMFRVGNRLFLVGVQRVLAVDVPSGKSVGGVELTFTPSTGLVHESRLFLAGTNAAACIDLDCNLVWQAEQPALREMWSFDFSLRCTRADGTELWSADLLSSGNPPGMCLGDEISQPDLES